MRFLPGARLLICVLASRGIALVNTYIKPLYAVVLLYFTSFVPVAVILTNRGSPFIEPRYMYFPALMVSMLVAYVLNEIVERAHRYSPAVSYPYHSCPVCKYDGVFGKTNRDHAGYGIVGYKTAAGY